LVAFDDSLGGDQNTPKLAFFLAILDAILLVRLLVRDRPSRGRIERKDASRRVRKLIRHVEVSGHLLPEEEVQQLFQ